MNAHSSLQFLRTVLCVLLALGLFHNTASAQINASIDVRYGPCNQSATLEAIIGPGIYVPPFTYQWSTGSTSNFITPTSSGTYTVTISDQASSSVFSTPVTITPNQILDFQILQKRHARLNTGSDDRTGFDYFGRDVDMHGDYAIVGAPENNIDGNGANPVTDAGAAYVFEFDGTTWNQIAKLVSPNRNSLDNFGASVSICTNAQGTFAVVGSPSDNTFGPNAGAVYVYDLASSWGLYATLKADVSRRNDLFGHSVSMRGNVLVVGAPQQDYDASNSAFLADAGAFYYFEPIFGGFIFREKVVASDRGAGDRFGTDLAVTDEAIDAHGNIGAYFTVVGASHQEDIGFDRGAAYAYELGSSSNWIQHAKLRPTQTNQYDEDYFGLRVAIEGEYIIVGSSSQDYDENDANFLSTAGAAYIFPRDPSGQFGGTVPEQKIVPDNRQAGDGFGRSVSISRGYAAVGGTANPNHPTNPSGAGAVFLFKGSSNNWTENDQINLLPGGDGGDRFGESVVINGPRLLVGAPNDEHDEVEGPSLISGAGSVYFYDDSCTCPPLQVTTTGLGRQVCPGDPCTGGVSVDFVSNGQAPFTYLWNTGQTTSSLNNVPQATYTVTVTDANGCTGIASQSFVCALRSCDIGFLRDRDQSVRNALAFMSVQPNPTSGDFTLDLGQPLELDAQITVFDLMGREVIKPIIVQNQQQVPLSLNVPAGLYHVVVQSGEERKALKLIVR